MKQKAIQFLSGLKLFSDPQLRAVGVHCFAVLISYIAIGILMIKMAGIGMLSALLILSLVNILLGTLHVRALYQNHEWAQRDAMVYELLFTLGLNLLAMISFIICMLVGGMIDLPVLFLASMMLFTMPYCIDRAFYLREQIPDKIMPWLEIKNLHAARGEMSFARSKQGIRWTFKKEGGLVQDLPDKAIGISGIDQLMDRSFGAVFKAFLLFHNVNLNPTTSICVEYTIGKEKKKQAHRWLFYHRRYWFSPLRLIDPNLSLKDNGLRFRKWKGTNSKGEVLKIRNATIYVVREPVVVEPKEGQLTSDE